VETSPPLPGVDGGVGTKSEVSGARCANSLAPRPGGAEEAVAGTAPVGYGLPGKDMPCNAGPLRAAVRVRMPSVGVFGGANEFGVPSKWRPLLLLGGLLPGPRGGLTFGLCMPVFFGAEPRAFVGLVGLEERAGPGRPRSGGLTLRGLNL